MEEQRRAVAVHPGGEQPLVDGWSATADTFAGGVHIEWDDRAPVTPLGQLPFFIGYLKQAGLFDAWVADCPVHLSSPNAPSKRDLIGTVMLSVLPGHRRYAHITALRCGRGVAKIEEKQGLIWLQGHLDYTTAPLLNLSQVASRLQELGLSVTNCRILAYEARDG